MQHYLMIILIAILLGIGVNYLADVLPIARRLSAPTCLRCGTVFTLTGYLLGKSCRTCGQKRPIRFWIVFLFLLIAAGLMARYPIPKLGSATSILLFSYLILIIVIDIENRLILHTTSLAGAVLAIWVGWQLHGITATILGGIAGFFVMLGLYLIGFLFIRVSKKIRCQRMTETDAIGFGDVNLSGIVGLLLGWPGVIGGLILAILIAGATSVIYLLWKIIRKQYHPDLALPYGPFLAFSVIVLLFIRPFFLR